MYSILVHQKGHKSRDHLIKALRNLNIDSRPFFFPIHRLPKYKSSDKLPITERLGTCGINLPSSPNLTNEKIKFICKSIIDFLN